MSWVAAAIGGTAVLGAAASNSAAKRQAGAADKATQAQLDMYDQTRADLAPWKDQGTIALDELSRLIGLTPMNGMRRPTRADAARIAEEGHRASFGTGYNSDSDSNRIAAAEQEAFDRLMAEYNAKVGDPSQGAMTAPLTKPFSLADFQESPAYQFNLQQGQKAIEKAAAKRGTYYAPQTLQDISKFSQGMASNEFNTAYGQYNQNMKNIWDRLYAMSGSGQNAAAQTGAFGTTVGGQIGENMTGAGNAQAAGLVGGANALAGGVNSYLNYSLMNQMLANNQQSSVGPRGNRDLTGANDLYGVA